MKLIRMLRLIKRLHAERNMHLAEFLAVSRLLTSTQDALSIRRETMDQLERKLARATGGVRVVCPGGGHNALYFSGADVVRCPKCGLMDVADDRQAGRDADVGG